MLPCSIKYNGPANVDEYFNKSITSEDGHLTASYIGRNLIGTELPVPSNYTGYIMNKSIDHLKAIGTF